MNLHEACGRLAGKHAGRKGCLEIEPSRVSVDIQDFACKIKSRHGFAFHGPGGNLISGNTSGGSQAASQTAEINRRAVAAYREKILEYMANPIPIIDDWEYVPDSFRVMDMNGDGIFEAMINFAGPLGRGIRRTDFLYYTDHLCSETIPSGMSHGDYYFYNPSRHLLMTYGFSEGPHFFYAYQYNGQTLEDVDSWTVNVDSGSADGPIGWRGSDSPDHVEPVLEWLRGNGAGCDCEVLLNVEEMFE